MDRARLGRGLAILAVAALAVAVVSPAFSAAPVTKGKVKKIAKKVAKKEVDAATIDQGNIPTVTASITDPNKTVATFGPFTITLDCSDDGGNVELRLSATTSEADSVADTGDEYGEFGPADEVQILNFDGDVPGGDAEVVGGSSYYGQATLFSPSGTKVYTQLQAITNFTGNHCFVEGWFLNLA
jgi:hypothetical protein